EIGDVLPRLVLYRGMPPKSTVLGYPATGAYTGADMYSITDSPSKTNNMYNIAGDFKFGSSGGPWLLAADLEYAAAITQGGDASQNNFSATPVTQDVLSFYEFIYPRG